MDYSDNSVFWRSALPEELRVKKEYRVGIVPNFKQKSTKNEPGQFDNSFKLEQGHPE